MNSRSLLETLTPVFPETSLFRQIFRFPKDPTPVSSTLFPLDPRVALTRARAPRVAEPCPGRTAHPASPALPRAYRACSARTRHAAVPHARTRRVAAGALHRRLPRSPSLGYRRAAPSCPRAVRLHAHARRVKSCHARATSTRTAWPRPDADRLRRPCHTARPQPTRTRRRPQHSTACGGRRPAKATCCLASAHPAHCRR